METDQLFLMDCYIKTIKVYYDKLPFFDSDKWWSRTFVNFNLFEHSKLEVQETEFSEKKAESSLVLNKGASCLFGLRDEQLLELCRNLGVTVIVSDEIKGTNEKIILSSKNMILPLSSTDLIHGISQNSHTNETKVNEFFMCDKFGQVVVHMSGYLRVTFLGRRVVTHFYFSKTLNDILYRTAGHGENCQQSKVSQAEAIKQITENLKSQQKEPADIEIWKVDPEFDISKTKAAEKTCLDNLRAKQNEETKSPERKDGLFERETTPVREANLAAELLLLKEAVRGAKIAEQLKIDGIVRPKAGSKDPLEVKCTCPFINFTKKADNLEAKEFVSAFTRGQCLSKASSPEPPSSGESSNEDTSVKNGLGQKHGCIQSPCPCLMGDQLIRFPSCPCMNKESKSTQSTQSTQVSDSPETDMAKASGEHRKEVDGKGIIIIKPGVESHSCTCMNDKAKDSDMKDVNDALIKKLGTKLFSCTCVAEQLDKVVKPMALFANLLAKLPMDKETKCDFIPTINPYIVYSCTCMINRGFHYNPAQETNTCPCVQNHCMHAHRTHEPCHRQNRMYSSGLAKISGSDHLDMLSENTQPSHNTCNAHLNHNAHNAHNAHQAHNNHNPRNSHNGHNSNTNKNSKEASPNRDCSQGKRVIESHHGSPCGTEEPTTNVESRIKQLLSDEYNIFIADSILPSNPMRRAEIERIKGGGSVRAPIITETFFPVPMTDEPQTQCDFENEHHEQTIFESQCCTPIDSDSDHVPASENQNNLPTCEVRNFKRQIPVIEVPYDSTTDIFLLKIKHPKQERHQTDKKANQNSRQAENFKKHSGDSNKKSRSPQRRDTIRPSQKTTRNY